MKQIITLVILSLLSAVTVSAQDYSCLIINGLKVDDATEYTTEDIAAALGEPYSVEPNELGVRISYYDHNQATATDADAGTTPSGPTREKWKAFITLNSVLHKAGPIAAAEIYSSDYLINGLVRVGDNIKKAMQMDGEWITDMGQIADDGSHPVYWRPECLKMSEVSNCVEFYCSADGTIESVSIWRY